MSASYVAGVIAILKAGLTIQNAGYGPPPVPARLNDASDFPYVTVHQVIDDQVQSLTGDSGLTQTIMQVNYWSPNYEDAFAARQAGQLVLLPFSGAVPGLALTVDAVNQVPGTELYDGGRELHQVIGRYRMWWVN